MSASVFRPAGFSSFFAPLGYEFWIARRSICDLFFRCGPAAIIGFIVSVVIDSVDGKLRGWFSHIGQKSFKNSPAFANGNTSSSIALITWIVWIGAAIVHSSPAIINTGSASRGCVTMGFWNAASVMTTVCYASSLQVGEVSNGRFATVALAQPSSLAVLVSMRKIHGGEEAKSLTRNVEEGWHV